MQKRAKKVERWKDKGRIKGQVNYRSSAITYDGPPPLVNYDYDLAGNRTVKTLENSTRAVSTYDDASRLTALDEQRSSGGVWTSLQSFAYTLNSVGNRTNRYETNAGLTKRDKYSYLADDLACSPKVDPGAMRDWRRDSAAELSP